MTDGITESHINKVVKLAGRIYPKHNLEGHIIPVVKIACKLANELNADYAICQIAAYMHDSGRVLYGCDNHDETGARYTRNKLIKFELPESIVEHITDCVLTHRGRGYSPKTIEAEIIANADALSHFEGALYEFGIHYSSCKNTNDTIEWLTTKFNFDLNNKFTIKQARDRAEYLLKTHLKPLLDLTREVTTL